MKKRGQKNNPKNNEQVLTERKNTISKLYIRGMSQVQIAKELGISQPAVCQHLVAIRKMWHENTMANFEEKQEEELERIRSIESEAWIAWERSKEDARVKTFKVKKGRPYKQNDDEEELKKGKRGKEKDDLVIMEKFKEKMEKEQVGNPQFLDQVLKCIEMRCKILGLIKPGVTNSTNTQVNVFDWDGFTKTLEETKVDIIEQKIASVGDRVVVQNESKEE